MANNLTAYAENKLVEHLVGKTTYTAPASTQLALHTVSPTDTTSGTEVTGSGYSRKLITWGFASAGSISTSADITFTSAGADWGTVTSFSVLDQSGNMLVYGPLTTPRHIQGTDSLTFTAGTITITAD